MALICDGPGKAAGKGLVPVDMAVGAGETGWSWDGATGSPDGEAGPASPPRVGDRRGPTFDFIWTSGQRLLMGG